MKRTLTIIGVILAILSVLVLAFILYAVGVTSDATLDNSKLMRECSFVHLYDCDGDEIPVTANARTDEIPEHVKKAFVAVEDKRFYTHNGVDPRRMLAALWHNLTSFSFAEGASTISQQLIKNTHLSSEKTISRKLKEIKLARQLEKQYSKEEILTLYLNSIYFGHSAFGIENAARFYFNKTARDLSVAEGATLAAMICSPNRYSPFRNAEACLKRRNLVLRLMHDQQYLSRESYENACKESLPASPVPAGVQSSYVECVFDELATLFPDAKAGDWGTLHVQTYLDSALQSELEQGTYDTDVCLLVRDNNVDAVRALHATAGVIKRLPASAIKPLLVYAPALEENLISPATPVLDEKTSFGDYSPDDFNGATGGYMSVRYALSHSVNIPAVRIFNELGIENGTKYLERMNLHVSDEDKSLALALGGMKEGFTLPALADGYATFAHGGNFCPAGFISRVSDEKGNVLYSHSPIAQRVFSEDVSSLVSDMLLTTVNEGTAKKLRALPFPVYAKTGTAGTQAGNTDAYCIAYTKDHVVATWMGNADNTSIKAMGGGLPANETLRVLRAVYRNKVPTPLETSPNVVRLSFDRTAYESEQTILLADPAAPTATTLSELFRSNNAPSAISTRFSMPSIRTPKIKISGGTIVIELYKTQYYDYEIKRENRGETTTIYNGAYRNSICDNCVRAGETYVYTVLPKYKEHLGTPVTLPSVTLPEVQGIPKEWWRD